MERRPGNWLVDGKTGQQNNTQFGLAISKHAARSLELDPQPQSWRLIAYQFASMGRTRGVAGYGSCLGQIQLISSLNCFFSDFSKKLIWSFNFKHRAIALAIRGSTPPLSRTFSSTQFLRESQGKDRRKRGNGTTGYDMQILHAAPLHWCIDMLLACCY